MNPNDNQQGNRQKNHYYYTIKKRFDNQIENKHHTISPTVVVGEYVNLIEFKKKNNMDDPPISTYDKNYGLAEKNSLFDAAEGGRRNNV